MSGAGPELLTTAQAAQRAGVSRFTLNRAAKAGLLQPIRDNRGALLWDAEALDRWAGDRPAQGAHAVPAQDAAQAEIAALRVQLAKAEADRDRWHEMAVKLADRPRRSWWRW